MGVVICMLTSVKFLRINYICLLLIEASSVLLLKLGESYKTGKI